MSEPWTTKDSQKIALKYINPLASSVMGVSNGVQHIEQSLPHMLDKYSAIYNKNGRVGIYTKDVSFSFSIYSFHFLIMSVYVCVDRNVMQSSTDFMKNVNVVFGRKKFVIFVVKILQIVVFVSKDAL